MTTSSRPRARPRPSAPTAARPTSSARDHHPQLARPGRGQRARRVRPHARAVRGVVHRGRAALAQGVGRGLGHRRVRDAPARDERAQPARVGEGQDRRAHARDLPPHRPVPARHHRRLRARREHDRAGLRRPPGRRRHAHRRDHRRLRRARRRRRVGPAARPHQGRQARADRLRRGRERRHHRRHAHARPPVRRGRPRRDGHERRRHGVGDVRRGPGHRGARPFDRAELDALLDLAVAGTADLTAIQRAALAADAR